jgi:hypothetical protein
MNDPLYQVLDRVFMSLYIDVKTYLHSWGRVR